MLRPIAVAVVTFLTASLMSVAVATPASADVSPGILTNNPLAGPARKFVVLRQINTAIREAHPGSQIRISSWNVRSPSAVRALIRAHQRGVSVQVIMANENASKRTPNALFKRLKKALSKGNVGRGANMNSFAMRCKSSCRGTTGITHTKYFLFSSTGSSSYVVMYGSANLTTLAATNQWNTLTTVFDSSLYFFMQGIFNEQRSDTPQPAPFRVGNSNGMTMKILPLTPGTPNPVLQDLNSVACTGVAPGYGNGRGQTRIRVAMTAMLGTLGVQIAQRLHQLQQQGCDIKVVYAVMGNRVLQSMRWPGPRGGVPIKQVVKDTNHDGVYDFYLHAKVMTINGNIGGNPAMQVAIDGSTNWTPVSMVSDETYMHLYNGAARLRYEEYVEWWFAHAPKSWSRRTKNQGSSKINRLAPDDGPAFGTKVRGVNPYRKVQIF